MIRVKDIMTKDVISVTEATTIKDLAKILTEHRISGAPVVDGDGKVLGIVSEGDLVGLQKNLHIPTVVAIFDAVVYLDSLKHFEDDLHKMTGSTVGDIYNKDYVAVTSESLVSEVATIMDDKKISTVPVVDDDKLVGVVGKVDIVRSLINA
ncbi:CBS domain-containing protein [Thermodesulfobacteriota bacterium]